MNCSDDIEISKKKKKKKKKNRNMLFDNYTKNNLLLSMYWSQ